MAVALRWATSTMVKTPAIRPAVSSAALGTSARREPAAGVPASTYRRVPTQVARPTGRLTRKIHRQSSAAVRRPPASRPIEPPAEATKPYTPIARARSAGSGKSETIMPSTTAEVRAPPTPWTNRAVTSIHGAVASAQASEETTNPAKKMLNQYSNKGMANLQQQHHRGVRQPVLVYLQSTDFVLDPAGNVVVSVYSSGAIGGSSRTTSWAWSWAICASTRPPRRRDPDGEAA